MLVGKIQRPFLTRGSPASLLDVYGGESGRLEQVDRGANNPHRNIITKPAREAKSQLWVVVLLMMTIDQWNKLDR
jgi:hypothetical protein